jgi:hypothetical protein
MMSSDSNTKAKLTAISRLSYSSCTHENRIKYVRKDIHQVWSTIFNNTSIIGTKLILAAIHRYNAKLEFFEYVLIYLSLPHETKINNC